jgi:hypothetical protein
MRKNPTKSTLRMQMEDMEQFTRAKTKSSDHKVLAKVFLSAESLNSESSENGCLKHSKPLEIYCATCEHDICVDCALFYDHRGHRIERSNGSRKHPSLLMDLRQRAEKMMEDSEQLNHKIEKDIISKRDSIKRLIEEKFAIVFEEVEKARDIALEFVVEHYESYEGKIRERIDFSREKVNKFITSLSKLTRPFETYRIEFEVLERNYGNDLLTDPMSGDILVVSFSDQLTQSIQAFCKTSLVNLKKRNSHTLKFGDDVNLLQESLNESAFKEINESSVGLDEKINEIFQSSQLMLNRSTLKSGSFAHTSNNIQNTKSPFGNELKSSLCGTPVNPNRQDKPGFFGHLSEEASKKMEQLNISGAVTKHRMTEISNVLGRSRIDSQPFSERVSRPEGVTPKRQSSRPLIRQVNEPRPSTYTRPSSIKAGVRPQCLNFAHFGLDDSKLEYQLNQTEIGQSVRTITLSGNHITERGVKFLLKLITPLNVETLFLSENNLRDRTLDYIISFSKYNTALKSVFLQDNKIDAKSAETKAKVAKLKRVGIQVFF